MTEAEQWKRDNLLELAERYARQNSYPATEQAVSDLFDESQYDIEDGTNHSKSIKSLFDDDDHVAVNEAFLNFVDVLWDMGHLHDVQVENYCYVGQFAQSVEE